MALRNHGIITQSDYIGKKLDEAKEYAEPDDERCGDGIKLCHDD